MHPESSERHNEVKDSEVSHSVSVGLRSEYWGSANVTALRRREKHVLNRGWSTAVMCADVWIPSP